VPVASEVPLDAADIEAFCTRATASGSMWLSHESTAVGLWNQQQPVPSTPHFSGARQAVCLVPR
jgi:hypothetical protein